MINMELMNGDEEWALELILRNEGDGSAFFVISATIKESHHEHLRDDEYHFSIIL